MSVAHVEVLVEEPSAEAALRILLPRILGDCTFEVYPHHGKDELRKRLPERLRGYAAWLPDDWCIVVVVDRDDDDCLQLKRELEECALAAGLATRALGGGRIQVVNRIAVEELEAWFFGDWEAVREAYPRLSPSIAQQAKFRLPDAISGGTWEALERVLQRAGYFSTGLRKIELARSVAAYMVPERNSSPSFQSLRDVLVAMTQP
jgi:hypothetical protein